MIKDYYTKVEYINSNCVPDISSWDLHDATYTAGTGVEIEPNGYMTTLYNNTGSKPAKYRKYIIELDSNTVLTQAYNYQNIIDLLEFKKCIDSNGEYTYVCNSVPVTLKGLSDNKITLETIDLNQEITYSSIKITNRSEENIIIKSVSIYRSNDTIGQFSDPVFITDLIETGGGLDVIDLANDSVSLIYMVPVMTLAEWNASDKTEFNEAIIVG